MVKLKFVLLSSIAMIIAFNAHEIIYEISILPAIILLSLMCVCSMKAGKTLAILMNDHAKSKEKE